MRARAFQALISWPGPASVFLFISNPTHPCDRARYPVTTGSPGVDAAARVSVEPQLKLVTVL
jgi:hypothetical protein